MLELSPLGPGFFLFFQQEEEPFVGTGIEEIRDKRAYKRKKDEDIILMVIKSFLEQNG